MDDSRIFQIITGEYQDRCPTLTDEQYQCIRDIHNDIYNFVDYHTGLTLSSANECKGKIVALIPKSFPRKQYNDTQCYEEAWKDIKYYTFGHPRKYTYKEIANMTNYHIKWIYDIAKWRRKKNKKLRKEKSEFLPLDSKEENGL